MHYTYIYIYSRWNTWKPNCDDPSVWSHRPSTILYYTILYYTILYYTIICYTVLYSTLFHSALSSALPHPILFYSILLSSHLLYPTLLYPTLPYSTPLYLPSCRLTDWLTPIYRGWRMHIHTYIHEAVRYVKQSTITSITSEYGNRGLGAA